MPDAQTIGPQTTCPATVIEPTADWITDAAAGSEARSIAFWAGSRWNCAGPNPTAVLRIAAECHYRLWVNDTLVGAGPVRGARTVNFVDSHPVGHLLRSGENSIVVAVQSPGWATFRESPALPSVWVHLPGEIGTGPGWWTRSMSGWRADPPTFTFQYGPMEWVDLADGPDRPPADAEGRRPARVIDTAGADGDPSAAHLLSKQLLPRDIPKLATTVTTPIAVPVFASVTPSPSMSSSVAIGDDVGGRMQDELHHPLELPVAVRDALIGGRDPIILDPRVVGPQLVLIVDFGQEVNGGFRLEVDSSAGTVIDIGYGEHLDDGRVRTRVGGYRFADRQRTRSGRQTVGTWFADRGFRYLQLVFRDLAEPVRLSGIRAVDRRYPFERRASFASSDDLQGDIWDLSLDTLQACATDTFVDCPWRENTLYVNDLLVENAVSLAAFGDGRLTARSLRLALAEAGETGLIPAAVPNGLQPQMSQQTADSYMSFPAMQLYLAEIVEDLLLYTGDRQTAEVMTRHLVGTIDSIRTWLQSDGLLRAPDGHWNFIDWGTELPYPHALDGRACASLNWTWVRALDCLGRLSGWTGISRDRVAQWRSDADRATAALRQKLWDPQRRVFTEASRGDHPEVVQASQALAITSGRLSPADWPRLDGADISASELYLMHYVLPADVGIGGTTPALERIRRHWGPMVSARSPTVWECGVTQSGASAFAGAGSLCHGFATSPVTLIQRWVLGVRPTAPGFAQFIVAPDLGDLEWARGDIPTPLGPVSVSWQRTTRGVDGEVVVPPGATCTVTGGATLTAGSHRLSLD